MQVALGRYVALLRAGGIEVSPGEVIDAATALTHTGLSERDEVRATLLATLVKRRRDRPAAIRLFDALFRPPVFPRKRKRKKKRDGDGGPAKRPGEGEGSAATRLRETSEKNFRALMAAKRGERGERVTRRFPTKVLTRPDGRREEESPHAPARTSSLAKKPFRDRWSEAESAQLATLLTRELARLRLRASRRKRRGRHGTLWVHRMLRESLATDGVPMRLVRRRPAKRHPRLLLLVDVSHSVARAAASFLTLSASLGRAFSSTHVWLFVDSVVDGTRLLPEFARLGGDPTRLESLLANERELNPLAHSDHGRVFHQLLDRAAADLRRDTVVVILGDARNNRLDPAAWTLESIRASVSRLFWLLPEPIDEWTRGDGAIRDYAPHVDLLAEIADLEGLRRALSRLF